MTIDAHQHFWRYDPVEYDWIDEPLAALRRDFLPDDLEPHLRAAGIDGTIAVQARQTVEETRWLLDLAAAHPLIRGVVGWLPLADPSVERQLEAWSAHARLKGVRHVVQAEPDPAFLDGAAFNAGVRAVAARGLAYDLLIYAHQLPAALRFADRHPALCLVLDHIAKPRIEGAPPPEWRRQLRELARRPHVTCKFSGVVTEVIGFRWEAAQLRPYFEEVVEAFGPARLMFGSDWPVCLVASGYADWHGFVADCAAGLSADERSALFGGTAARVYRLS